jgi:hypothetical protein
MQAAGDDPVEQLNDLTDRRQNWRSRSYEQVTE